MTTLPASVTIVDLPAGTTVTGAELFEAVQTTSGVGQSVQLSLTTMLALGGLPTGGATGTILNKTSGSNYSTTFSPITTFIAVGTALATSGVNTSIVVSVANNGISSAQIASFAIFSTAIATNAIGTNQLATNIGITGTFNATGAAAFAGGITATGTFGQNGTATFTSTFILGSLGAGILNASSTGVVSSQGGMVLLNTLLPSAVASTNDTTSFTSAYRNYMIMFDTVCPASQTATLQITLATSGSAFTTAGYVSMAQVDVNATVVTDTSTAALLMTGTRVTTQLQTSTVIGVSGFVKFFNPSSSVNNKTMVGEVTYPTPGALSTSTLALASINGVYVNASPVTGINFAFNPGNIATGVIKIYAIT